MNELEQIQELFAAALQRPESQRTSFVRGTPYGESVRTEVLHLLEHHLEKPGVLDAPAVDSFAGLAGQAGREIGSYRIIRGLGRGRSGVVYLARDTALHRTVAIKVLSNDLLRSPFAVERLGRHMHAAARLIHPAIVPVYEWGEDRGVHYIVRQYIEGESLGQRLESARTQTERNARTASGQSTQTLVQSADGNSTEARKYVRSCVHICAMVAEALDCAHQAGVMHGDVKPSDILINGREQALLTDFGLAHLNGAEQIAPGGDPASSRPYLSPERRAGQGPDARADVFSVGVVLYQMLSLRLPFSGASADATDQTPPCEKPEPLTQLNPAVPKELENICLRAIEADPRDRYPTAAKLVADLERFLRGDPIRARPAMIVRRSLRWMRRHRTQSLIYSVFMLIALASLAVGTYRLGMQTEKTLISIRQVPASVDAMVAVQRWDASLQSYGPAEELGTAPLIDRYFDPGFYRFSVIRNPREFMELDVIAGAGTECRFSVSIPRMGDVTEGMIELMPGSYTFRPVRRKNATEDTAFFLDGFLLDRFEVSNGQYKEFVEAMGHPPPHHWSEYGYDHELAKRPVVNVSRSDAEAYARWRGKRLPTAAEWEAAARAPDARLYPWGPRSTAPKEYGPDYEALLQMQTEDETIHYQEYMRRTRDVDDDPFPHTVSGFFHLFGNVAELTSTVMDDEQGETIVKGGSWMAHPDLQDLRRGILVPNDRSALHIGFRCARSLQPPPIRERR